MSKERTIQYILAGLGFISGIVLCYISFFSHGEVTDGVLWYMGQMVTYASAVGGVGIYIAHKGTQIKTDTLEMVKKQLEENNEK